MENKLELTISILKSRGFNVQGYSNSYGELGALCVIMRIPPKDLIAESLKLYWLLLQEFDIELNAVESPYLPCCDVSFDPADPKYGLIKLVGIDDKLLNSKGIFSVTRTKIESITDIDNK